MKALIFLMLLSLSSVANAASETEEFFYRSGKIQVVIAVVMIVLGGLLLYLFRLDKKVTQWEKSSNNRKQ
jgi:hypothetical protein